VTVRKQCDSVNEVTHTHYLLSTINSSRHSYNWWTQWNMRQLKSLQELEENKNKAKIEIIGLRNYLK